jgi:hypothetical protein
MNTNYPELNQSENDPLAAGYPAAGNSNFASSHDLRFMHSSASDRWDPYTNIAGTSNHYLTPVGSSRVTFQPPEHSSASGYSPSAGTPIGWEDWQAYSGANGMNTTMVLDGRDSGMSFDRISSASSWNTHITLPSQSTSFPTPLGQIRISCASCAIQCSGEKHKPVKQKYFSLARRLWDLRFGETKRLTAAISNSLAAYDLKVCPAHDFDVLLKVCNRLKSFVDDQTQRETLLSFLQRLRIQLHYHSRYCPPCVHLDAYSPASGREPALPPMVEEAFIKEPGWGCMEKHFEQASEVVKQFEVGPQIDGSAWVQSCSHNIDMPTLGLSSYILDQEPIYPPSFEEFDLAQSLVQTAQMSLRDGEGQVTPLQHDPFSATGWMNLDSSRGSIQTGFLPSGDARMHEPQMCPYALSDLEQSVSSSSQMAPTIHPSHAAVRSVPNLDHSPPLSEHPDVSLGLPDSRTSRPVIGTRQEGDKFIELWHKILDNIGKDIATNDPEELGAISTNQLWRYTDTKENKEAILDFIDAIETASLQPLEGGTTKALDRSERLEELYRVAIGAVAAMQTREEMMAARSLQR